MIKNTGSPRRNIRLSLIVIPAVVVGLMLISFLQLRASLARSHVGLLAAASERIALRIEGELNALLDIGQQFRTALQNEGDTNYSSLKSLADLVLPRHPSIASITIAPGAIIRYSFPEDGSAASIGHDLLDNPERMQALVAAVSKKAAVLQGPDLSAEGLQLAFLRIPVFRTQDLWGFVSIAIDVDSMLRALKLSDEFPGLRIACGASEAGNAEFFWGDERLRSGATSAVRLGGEPSSWLVSVASVYPASGALWWAAAIAALGVIGLGALILLQRAGLERPRVSAKQRPSRFDVNPFVLAELRGDREARSAPKPAAATRSERGELGEPAALSEVPQSSQGTAGTVSEPAATSSGRALPPGMEAETEPRPAAQALPQSETENLTRALAISAAADAPEPIAPKSVSVLVADDSEVNRELLVRMLTLRNYRVDTRPSGVLALDALEAEFYDVVLIDCIMPEMDGYQLAALIRNRVAEPSPAREGMLAKGAARTRNIPTLIAMSPRHDAEEADKCERAGFDGLLIKPFTMTSLDQKIQEMLGARDRA